MRFVVLCFTVSIVNVLGMSQDGNDVETNVCVL